MIRYFELELLRAVRDPRYLVLAVLTPVGLYLLFTQLFGTHGERVEGLPQPTELMVAMAAYGGMWAVFSATAPRIAHERSIGWLRQLRITPLRPGSVGVVKVAASLAAALPAIGLVCLTAVAAHGIRLDAGEWASLLAGVWVGTLPLALLGLAIGYLVGPDAAYGVVMVLYFAFGALGGLWMPMAMLPDALQHVGRLLPTHGLADLGWKLAAGSAPDPAGLAVLGAWTAASLLVAVVAGRRPS